MSDDLYPEKHSVIMEMYVHTADENYINARMCYQHGLYLDFFWQSLHALEKYMKAVLLINGRSVKKYGHRLPELYAEVEKIASGLLPAKITKPAAFTVLPKGWWRDRTPAAFMKRLYDNGNAENRYLTFGFNKMMEELHMIDRMVWVIRRLVVPLDQPIVPERVTKGAPTHRTILTKQPDHCPQLGMPLDKAIHTSDSPLHFWALNNNYAFAPVGFAHQPEAVGTSSRTPVLLRRIIDPLQSGNADYARSGYQMGLWLFANTQLSTAVRNEIQTEMDKALAKHPGIDKSEP
jgi:HEPN domain-containing protein